MDTLVEQRAVAPADLADALARFRKRQPHVHCVTNAVAQNVTANVLLAAGATPSMTIAPEEVADFASAAAAVLVNLGTLDDQRREAAWISIDVCREAGKPWVLDPVFVNASRPRLELALALLDEGPALVRANTAEHASLFGHRDVDANTVLAVTGERDDIRHRRRRTNVANGSPLATRVTAMGCALTALAAGFVAANEDPFTATIAAHAFFGLACERAEAASNGPGSFQIALLDTLHALTPDDLAKGARIS